MFFVGRTRYSQCLPDSYSWNLSARDEAVEDYRARLYAPARLELREKLFTQFALPSLDDARKAAGIDLVHVVSFSQSLPDRFKRGLEDAAARFPFLLLDEQPEGNSGRSLDDIARRHVKNGEAYGRFRIDDDDILAMGFFKSVVPYVAPHCAGMVVSLPLGIDAIYDAGRVFFPRISHWPMHSMGLLDVCCFLDNGQLLQPQSGAHNTSDRRAPVILDAREMSYFRINHVDQDSGLRGGKAKTVFEIMHGLSHFSPLEDLESLRTLFPRICQITEVEHWEELKVPRRTIVVPSRIKLRQPVREAHFVIDHEFPRRSRQRQGLVSLDIRDDAGVPVARGRELSGIGHSPWKAIGYFCYLNSVPGSASTRLDIMLPEDLRL